MTRDGSNILDGLNEDELERLEQIWKGNQAAGDSEGNPDDERKRLLLSKIGRANSPEVEKFTRILKALRRLSASWNE